jgi:phospholipase C
MTLTLAVLVGCSAGAGGAGRMVPSGRADHLLPPITHVVVIVQENRSLDNLFNGFPKAHTVQVGMNSLGQQVSLVPVPLVSKFDVYHTHPSFTVEYAGGKMDGFNLAGFACKGNRHYCPPSIGATAYGYVPKSDVRPYWQMASEYVLADEMFQSNSGPSFPAHQYLISGTSTIVNGSGLRVSENARDSNGIPHSGGCDSTPGTVVKIINDAGKESAGVFPCFERLSIFDALDNGGLSWKYYQAYGGSGTWNAVDAIRQIWQKPEFKQNVVWPPSQVLTDIAGGNLAAVSFVTPTVAASDHALANNGTGPAWVASVVNAVGKSQYWNSTAIFVLWDDWGGWYDHVAPKQYNSYELGMRVPLLVISPYARHGHVSHVPHEFGSILKFIEEEFGLPSLGTTDVRADDLRDCFRPMLGPQRFQPIRADHGPAYFLRQPIVRISPDDD